MAKSDHIESNETNNEELLKRCLFITPISNPSSEIRQLTDGIISAIQPVLKEFGYVLNASHEISISGSINDQVIDRLINDELVIANLTSFNPNVMYELAVRHCTAKPVILIVKHGEEIPFDLLQERKIQYTDSISGGELLKKDVRNAIKDLVSEEHLRYNPIYKVARYNLIEQNLKKSDDSFSNYMLSSMQNLSQQFVRLANNLINSNNHTEYDLASENTFSHVYDFKVKADKDEPIKSDDIHNILLKSTGIGFNYNRARYSISSIGNSPNTINLTINSRYVFSSSVIAGLIYEFEIWGYHLTRIFPVDN